MIESFTLKFVFTSHLRVIKVGQGGVGEGIGGK